MQLSTSCSTLATAPPPLDMEPSSCPLPAVPRPTSLGLSPLSCLSLASPACRLDFLGMQQSVEESPADQEVSSLMMDVGPKQVAVPMTF